MTQKDKIKELELKIKFLEEQNEKLLKMLLDNASTKVTYIPQHFPSPFAPFIDPIITYTAVQTTTSNEIGLTTGYSYDD